MLDAIKLCLLLSLLSLVLVECRTPKSYNVVKIDEKVIQRKRQDTMELCKMFEAENNGHPALQRRSKRVKREYDVDAVGAPEDLQRVEQIVDKIYDDINEKQTSKVTYKRRFNVVTTPQAKHRRFDFAPHFITYEPEERRTSTDPTIPDKNKTSIVIENWPKKWIFGIIPYYIDPKTYDAQLSAKIEKAFEYFEKETCIRLQKLHEKPNDKASLENVEWIYIANPSGIHQCVHSNENKANKGVQLVVIGYDCMTQGQIAHEVMHILGFSHEHTRPDRDGHIDIFWENIKDGYKKYFSLRTEDPFNSLTYDFESVMHYPSRAFSRNGKNTISIRSDLNISTEVRLGQRDRLSNGDLEKIEAVYDKECTSRTTEYLQQTCPSAIKGPQEPPEISEQQIKDYFQSRLWDLGVVEFKMIDQLEFTIEEKENIKNVINHIEKETCIKFKDMTRVQPDPYTPEAYDPNDEHKFMKLNSSSSDSETEVESRRGMRRHDKTAAVVFVRGNEPGCPCPPPGKPSNELNITINGECFQSPDTLLHLFVHVLGLDHQHNMHDRDSYLKIMWDKLTPELKNEMSTKLPPEASAGFSYDYQSVMHLPWLQIKDGVQNIIYPIWHDGWSMGNWEGLSITDVQKINKIYRDQCAAKSALITQFDK